MGLFTFTDARFHPYSIQKTKSGDYPKNSVIGYDGYARLLCPNGTDIIETSYEGYGVFNGCDVYELVAEWNKAYLTNIFDELAKMDKSKSDATFPQLRKAAELYAASVSIVDEYVDEIINDLIDIDDPYIKKNWKRSIGIAIACGKNNLLLPYPIKITKQKSKGCYNDMNPSLVIQ